MKITRNLRIYGRVQGVYYRESLRQQAEISGVTGWVRNRRDGSVEAMLQGALPAVEAVIVWCWRGPAMAQVERVDIAEGEGEFDDFSRLDSV